MKRGTRLGLGVLLSFVASLLLVVGSDADAQRGRRRRRAPAVVMSDAVEPALGGIQWGWNRQEVETFFTTRINEEFRDRIHKARDAMTEDRERHARDQKVRRMHESFLEFNGQPSGHDSGFLRDEFTQGNGEAMMRVRGADGDDFYFFINGRLWKWYHAFDSARFRGATFADYGAALSERFGPGREQTGRLVDGADERTWMQWEDQRTRVRAIDNSAFFGFFGLVFEDKSVLAQLPQLRTQRRTEERRHGLVEAVTSGGDEVDANPDVVDRITGRIQRRPDIENQNQQ